MKWEHYRNSIIFCSFLYSVMYRLIRIQVITQFYDAFYQLCTLIDAHNFCAWWYQNTHFIDLELAMFSYRRNIQNVFKNVKWSMWNQSFLGLVLTLLLFLWFTWIMYLKMNSEIYHYSSSCTYLLYSSVIW